MAKFKITWSEGVDEIVEQSDCDTVEQFENCRFGSAKTAATVELVEAEEVKTEPAKTAAKTAKVAK